MLASCYLLVALVDLTPRQFSIIHILDFISVGGEISRLLLDNLSSVCNLIARGLLPPSVRDALYGSRHKNRMRMTSFSKDSRMWAVMWPLTFCRDPSGVPKLIYLPRTSPAFKAKAVFSHVDDQFVAAFEGILKISLSGDALIQLSLPVSVGGTGIPTPSGITLSAFASSCYAAG